MIRNREICLFFIFIIVVVLVDLFYINKTQFFEGFSFTENLQLLTKNVFFVETNSELDYFSTRVTCAFESAALQNPSSLIRVFSLNAKFNNSYDIIAKYPNLQLIKLNLTEIFEETPLLSWWKTGSVKKSPYLLAHLADAFRLAILWKYGGVYSDIDTITLKSFIGIENYDGVGLMPTGGTPDIGKFYFDLIFF